MSDSLIIVAIIIRLFLEKIIAAEIEALNTCRESTAQMEVGEE